MPPTLVDGYPALLRLSLFCRVSDSFRPRSRVLTHVLAGNLIKRLLRNFSVAASRFGGRDRNSL